MTKEQEELVRKLRLRLFATNYPPIVIVSNEELCAAEESITEWLEAEGKEPILRCGKHGLYFKGCELVLEVK